MMQLRSILYDEISKFIIEDMSDVISIDIDTLRIHADPEFLYHFRTQLREFCECYIDLMRIRKCYIRSLDLKLKECLVYLGSPDITAADLLTHVLAIRKCSYHAKNFIQCSTRKDSFDFLLDMCERLDQFKFQLDEYKIKKVEVE